MTPTTGDPRRRRAWGPADHPAGPRTRSARPYRRSRLLDLVSAAGMEAAPATLEEVRQLYEKADVFEKAHQLVDKHQDRAEVVADILPRRI